MRSVTACAVVTGGKMRTMVRRCKSYLRLHRMRCSSHYDDKAIEKVISGNWQSYARTAGLFFSCTLSLELIYRGNIATRFAGQAPLFFVLSSLGSSLPAELCSKVGERIDNRFVRFFAGRVTLRLVANDLEINLPIAACNFFYSFVEIRGAFSSKSSSSDSVLSTD